LTQQEQYEQYEQRANAILAQQSKYNENRRQQQPQQHSGSASSGGARTIPGMGGHLLKRKERRVPGGEHDTTATLAAAGDFNFEERLNAFDKEEEFSKLSVEEPKTHYQKSSFFDTISCDALDRLEGNKGRMSGYEERKLNTETFGAVGLNNRRSFRGGRGGGGRGGGRGGNRRGGGGQQNGGGWGGRGGSGRGGGRGGFNA